MLVASHQRFVHAVITFKGASTNCRNTYVSVIVQFLLFNKFANISVPALSLWSIECRLMGELN